MLYPAELLWRWRHLQRNLRQLLAAQSEHTFVLMRKNFDEAVQHVRPVRKNPRSAAAASQFQVARDQAVNQFDIARLDHRLEVHRSNVAALRGKIRAVV